MLSAPKIEEIVRAAAKTQIARGAVTRVLTSKATDSEGNEAVRITFVLTPRATDGITGDEALDLLTKVQRRLQDQGEERFPIVEYATEQELALEGPLAGQSRDPDEA